MAPKYAKYCLIVFLTLILVGWTPIPEDKSLNSNQVEAASGYGGTIYIRYAPDGTKCAVLNAGRAGGISCDWAGESDKNHRSKRNRSKEQKRDSERYQSPQ